jgi:hypothetical protein
MNDTPEDIDKILKKAFEKPAEGAATFQHEVDLAAAGVDLSDHSEERALIMDDARKDGVTVPDLPAVPEVPPESTFDTDPVAEARAAFDKAFLQEFDFATIEIGAVERDRYYRCGLHDEEMWFLVEVPGADLSIKVAIPSVSRSEAAIAALDAWGAAGEIGQNSMQYLHGFQLLNVWLMVREINGKPTDWYEQALEEAGGKLAYRNLRALLSNPDTVESVREIGDVRWQAVTLAVRIAEYRHKLCLDAVRTRKVFTTAGSA